MGGGQGIWLKGVSGGLNGSGMEIVLFFFTQSSRQITMAMHCTAHDDFALTKFIEEQMLFEGAENDEETPVAQSWMIKASEWA